MKEDTVDRCDENVGHTSDKGTMDNSSKILPLRNHFTDSLPNDFIKQIASNRESLRITLLVNQGANQVENQGAQLCQTSPRSYDPTGHTYFDFIYEVFDYLEIWCSFLDLEFYVKWLMILLWNSLNTSTYIVSSGPTAIFIFISCFLINRAIPFITCRL